MTMRGIPIEAYKRQPKRLPRSLGFSRYALSFDGENDKIALPSTVSLDAHRPFTLEVRAKSNVTGVHKTLYSEGNSGDDIPLLIFRRTNNNFLEAQLRDDVPRISTLTGTTALGTEWNDFVWVERASNDREIYLNGNSEGKNNHSMGPITLDTFTIGVLKRVTELEHWDGLINGVRIYNRALTEAERHWNILNHHNPVRQGLVLWLPMEEGSGEIVYDKSGNGNNGTLLPAGAGPIWEMLRQWELRSAVE